MRLFTSIPAIFFILTSSPVLAAVETLVCIEPLTSPATPAVEQLDRDLNATLLGQTLRFPNYWQQLVCIREGGACVALWDSGHASARELTKLDRDCRKQTRFDGPPVTSTQFTEVCRPSEEWNEANKKAIEAIRKEAKLNDAEALARFFEDPRIQGGQTLAGRLDAVLEALEDPLAKGARTGIEFSDEGFRGTRERNGPGFKDPHPQSRNQVGHFMTAVSLGWDTSVPQKTNEGVSIRRLLGAPDGMSDEAVTLHLIVGHEKAADPDDKANPISKYFGFKKQFHSASEAEVATFVSAESALGPSKTMDMENATRVLQKIDINPDWNGNSIQDLRLSLAGWHLGRMIRAGQLENGAAVADWIRKNLKE